MEIYKQNKTIGILGGMGPQASARLYELIIKYARDCGAKRNDSYPEIILYSVPVPDFISDSRQEEVAKKMLVSRVKALSFLPISYFCIACNTAHLLIDDLKNATSVPFISLIEETVKELKRFKMKKVGLQASPSTINSGLYQKRCREEGIEIVLPKRGEVLELGEIIRRVIGGKITQKDRDFLKKVARELIRQGVDVILLSCTELPLIFPKRGFRVVSTLDVLAKACIKKYYGNI